MKRLFVTIVLLVATWGLLGCEGSVSYKTSVKLRFDNFDIANRTYDQGAPAVAYCHDQEEFFVVWQDDRNGIIDIYGVMLDDYGGMAVGNEILVSDSYGEIAHNDYYSVPAIDPYNVTLTGFHISADVKAGSVQVSYAAGGSFTEVTLPAANGQVSVNYNTGTFTFHSSDAGANVSIVAVEEYDLPGDQTDPALAYDGASGQYLVVWEDDRSADLDIYGQLIDAVDGDLIGENFAINASAGDQRNPKVVYNEDEGTFFVVYETGSGSARDILANIVGDDGSVGGVIIIDNNAARAQDPDVVWNSRENEFFVVWADFRTEGSDSDIWGVICDETGTPGTSFEINADAADQQVPVVAYASDPARNHYLVAWEDYSDPTLKADIITQIVKDDGSMTASEVNITNSGWRQVTPAVAYEPTEDYFIVLWQDDFYQSYDIFGQIVDAEGSKWRNFTAISSTPWGADERGPALALNSREHEFLFVFSCDINDDWDVTGQIGW